MAITNNPFFTVAQRSAWTSLAAQTGYAAIKMAPVALTPHALGAVAIGGAISAGIEYSRDRFENVGAGRRSSLGSDPSTADLENFLVTLNRIERDVNPLRLLLRTGFEAAIGAAVLGLAGVSGVLPITVAFCAGAVGTPLVLIGLAATTTALGWLYQPVRANS